MKQSTNYNMNKPDPNDMFSLEHWNQNTDKIDETLAPTFEDYTGETPVPTTDEALKNIKSKTKLSILMQNIKAFCKGCCTLGMLVDNCVTNNNNLPLAASQGKILMDQITSLNSDFSAKNASLEIGQVERGAYIYLRNKVTNNLLMLRLNEDDKKLVFNSEVDGQWGSETQLVTKSDLVKKATVTLNLSGAGTASILAAKLGIVVGVNTNNTNAICDLISINDEWYVRFREIISDVPITGQVTLDYWYIPAQ